MNKIDEKKFQRAAEIAHSYFWLSDSLFVLSSARNKIEKRMLTSDHYIKPSELLGEYVAIICLEAVLHDERQRKELKKILDAH